MKLLPRIAGEFKSWNQHTPSRLCWDLHAAINGGDWDAASAIAEKLAPYFEPFRSGDSEGQFWAEEFQQCRAAIAAAPRPPKQLDLF